MPTFNLTDLQTKVYNRLENNTDFYTITEVTRAINDAVKVANLFSGFIQATLPVPGGTVANQVDYATPTGLIFPLRVTIGGQVIDKRSWTSMGQASSSWRLDTTANTGIAVSIWVPAGVTMFALNPADSTGGQVIGVTGVAEPTPLVGGADIVQIPNEFVDIVMDLASHILPLKEGGLIFSQAANLYVMFLSRMKKFKFYQTMRYPAYWVEVNSPA